MFFLMRDISKILSFFPTTVSKFFNYIPRTDLKKRTDPELIALLRVKKCIALILTLIKYDSLSHPD